MPERASTLGQGATERGRTDRAREERFRVDGIWIEDCQTPEPMYPMLNTYIIGEDDWADDAVGDDPAAADYPYTHEFEWVRVWQREERL